MGRTTTDPDALESVCCECLFHHQLLVITVSPPGLESLGVQMPREEVFDSGPGPLQLDRLNEVALIIDEI
jgi:hypothetical protein